MIHYSLVCAAGHSFDGWFRNSADFDAQNARNLLTCPVCGADKVEKQLMAPAVATSRKKEMNRQEKRDAAPEAAPAGSLTDTSPSAAVASSLGTAPAGAEVPAQVAEVFEKIRELKKELMATSDYVGPKFAEEARKIHYGEADKRGIYGEASRDDVEALVDEGIGVIPLPTLPEDMN